MHLNRKEVQYWYITGSCAQNIQFNGTIQSCAGDTCSHCGCV